MDKLFIALKKGAVGITSVVITIVGFVTEHADTLPIPSSWGPYIQFAGLLATLLSHSPLPSKPDGR